MTLSIARRCVLTLCALALVVPAAAQMGEMGRPAQMDVLKWAEGEWTAKVSFRMGPDQPWAESAAKATIAPVLDGCAQKMTFDGEMMGMPFKGVDHTTYSRERGRYESVWVDTMSAHFSHMHGNFEGDKMVMYGKEKMGDIEFQVRNTTTKVSNDEMHWTMENSADGQTWFTAMKVVYTRSKK